MGGAPVAADPQVSGDYRLDVVENQQVIFSQSFPRPEEMVFTDTLDGGGATVQNASSISLYVPYVSEKQVASLYFKGARVATYTFTNLCNRNSRCEGEEDYLSCPSDCAKKNIDAYSAMYIATTNESSIPGINDYPNPSKNTYDFLYVGDEMVGDVIMPSKSKQVIILAGIAVVFLVFAAVLVIVLASLFIGLPIVLGRIFGIFWKKKA